MTTLAKEVTNRGYHYFDWNVGSSDTVSSCSSSCIYNNVVKGLTSYHTLVVLMHDFSGNTRTLNALRDIIRYGKIMVINLIELLWIHHKLNIK